mgnify:CR=1 FL=1
MGYQGKAMNRELNKATYSSGEAATLLQVPARTLRRYLTIGRIRGKQKDRKSTRLNSSHT